MWITSRVEAVATANAPPELPHWPTVPPATRTPWRRYGRPRRRGLRRAEPRRIPAAPRRGRSRGRSSCRTAAPADRPDRLPDISARTGAACGLGRDLASPARLTSAAQKRGVSVKFRGDLRIDQWRRRGRDRASEQQGDHEQPTNRRGHRVFLLKRGDSSEGQNTKISPPREDRSAQGSDGVRVRSAIISSARWSASGASH